MYIFAISKNLSTDIPEWRYGYGKTVRTGRLMPMKGWNKSNL